MGSFGGTRKGQSVLMNKVADAVSMSLPALSEHSGGMAEYLKPNEDVFCCDSNAEAIGKALYSVFSDLAIYRKMASNLEPIYENQLSPNAFYKRLNGLLV